MKKTLLTLCLAAFACSATMAQTPAQEISGTYTGMLSISLGNPIDEEALVLKDKIVRIEAVADDAVSFTLPDFSFDEMQLGDIFLPHIPVSKATDVSVRFGENAPESFSFLNGMITATAKINETASNVRAGEANIDVDVVWTNSETLVAGTPDLPIYVRFSGTQERNEANRYDLNSDGSVDVSDVSELVDYILTH